MCLKAFACFVKQQWLVFFITCTLMILNINLHRDLQMGHPPQYDITNLNFSNLTRVQPIRWQITKYKFEKCNNTYIGKDLAVDNWGFVCPRSQLVSIGCCRFNIRYPQQYSCNSCNMETKCCLVYERCVACCMSPNLVQQHILEDVMARATGIEAAIYSIVQDQFELCLFKCRTVFHYLILPRYCYR